MNLKKKENPQWNYRGIIFLFFFLFFATGRAEGERTLQPSVDLYMEQTMKALYAFNFEQANTLSTEMILRFPNNYLSHFTRSQYLWWMIITHPQNPRLEEAYYQSLKRSLSAIKPLINENHSYAHIFYFINIYAMQARLFLDKKEYLRTIFSLKSCIDQIEASIGKEEVYLPFNLSSGMYNYMLEYARQKYPFLALYTLLYPRGDRELGLEQLHTAARSDHFIWRTEAGYLLMRIYLDLEQQPEKALPLLRALLEEYPSNLIFRQHFVKILERMGEQVKAGEEKAALTRATRMANELSEAQRHHLLSVFGE
ncbi:MAG: hypothetical protein V2I46_10810 [Bacteroides sp.]|jgi:tetratricopeptide (TPR) repeat protein|nr:hypothetical protein [Bacteroides sp.]